MSIKNITATVGKGGTNIPSDVATVQYLLNCVPFSNGEPRRELKIDGFAGVITTGAIDGTIGGSGAEFINHSCDPNLVTRIGGGRIFFVSCRRISAGEELTLDYNITFATDLPCSCGAEKCRGIINQKA